MKDLQADVVVVGFGAAGACTAMEAREAGAEVLVIDRFGGGGATAMSGGVVYAGGGTTVQRAAGVEDTVDAMVDYLRQETGGAISEETLRRFCAGSADQIAWLAERGVPFEPSLCPYKTSYPTNRHYLYYSGSELANRDIAPPAPRGHRTRGRGTSGKLFYARLAAAARSRGVRVLAQTRAVRLVTDESGRVTGVEASTLAGAPAWARLTHRVLHRFSVKPGLYVPALGRSLHRPVAWIERRFGRPVSISATRGVVLAAGGFVFNRPMLREHAPLYRGGLPLGTPGDDGSGIRLGVEAGAATDRLDRLTIWRFITPPAALQHGVLVDSAGHRICDESRYGAAIGDAIMRSDKRKAWLLVDREILAEARGQLRSQTLWFQRVQASWLLRKDRVAGPTLAAVAQRAGVDADALAVTVKDHNAAAAAGAPDPAGKAPDLVRPLEHPPYSLIDCSIRPRMAQPAPMLTLGGLVVDENTGQVRRADGSPVPGLYAAGRTAVGVCSNSYVSGLSLADCVFSGRRAGRQMGGPDADRG
ncbi:FAD-binding protein [Virgisporangium aurantiacum]|uniref:23S rRNA methyltransferase n=1 Tax=Virgisporangium aurantiacum TaxID=175570 RepID=A0A8J4E6C1_9ACTN|nr:FAD-binding protein [Virgisporangium aurantiacum]GIJ60672.1 23S rRNA methyltransferase [Virgisporangium aurantiacum]